MLPLLFLCLRCVSEMSDWLCCTRVMFSLILDNRRPCDHVGTMVVVMALVAAVLVLPMVEHWHTNKSTLTLNSASPVFASQIKLHSNWLLFIGKSCSPPNTTTSVWRELVRYIQSHYRESGKQKKKYIFLYVQLSNKHQMSDGDNGEDPQK